MEITFYIKEGGNPIDRLSLNRIADGVQFRYNGDVLFVITNESRQEFTDALEYVFSSTPNPNTKKAGR